jgi:4-methoxybenzoate monooxygenase (O-demethylating)
MVIMSSRSPYAIYDSEPPPGVLVVDTEPFSIGYFRNPQPYCDALREAPQFGWLSKYKVAAVDRLGRILRAAEDLLGFSRAGCMGVREPQC